jgi:DNA-directed RNA polymerase specialized sigma24 family protein
MAIALTEQQLLDRAVAGDRSALERLLLAHYDRLAKVIDQKLPADLRSVVSTEDVLQETCFDAFRSVGSFHPSGPDAFPRWLFTIAEHRLLDLIKTHWSAKRGGARAPLTSAAGGGEQGPVVALLDLLAVDEHTPSRSVAGHEAEAAVLAASGQVKPEYAEALRMRYF